MRVELSPNPGTSTGDRREERDVPRVRAERQEPDLDEPRQLGRRGGVPRHDGREEGGPREDLDRQEDGARPVPRAAALLQGGPTEFVNGNNADSDTKCHVYK